LDEQPNVLVATSTRRRVLDLLRAVATLRVVVYHASGDPRWSWIAAIPVMFFVGGSLFAASLDRRPAGPVLRSRLRRVLVPTVAYVAVAAAVVTLARGWHQVRPWAFAGIEMGSARTSHLYWTWMHLWYVFAYVVFMLLGVPLRRVVRSRPLLVLGPLAAICIVSGALRDPLLGAGVANLFFWLLGMSLHDRGDQTPSRPWCVVLGVAAAGVGLAYGSVVTGFQQVVTAVPFLTLAMGLAWLLLAASAEPWLEDLMRFRAVDVPVRFLQQRALTIYLWHAAAIGIVRSWVDPRWRAAGATWVQVALTLGVTFVLTLCMGWIEDLAAGRSPRVVPPLGVIRRRAPVGDDAEAASLVV
jgi:peptidoglycan/LPS O-acetylase OafA/YrhL